MTEVRRQTVVYFLLLASFLYGCNSEDVYDGAETFYASANQIDSTGSGYIFLKQGSYGLNKGSYLVTARIPYHRVGKLKIFQGDIIVDPFLAKDSLILKYREKKSEFWARPSGIWPDGIVYYKFDSAVSSEDQATVKSAMDAWNIATSGLIQFQVAKASDVDFLIFKVSSGYASEVGMQGGAQEIYMTDAPDKGNVMHEIGHAIGLWHEHSRADRDKYIKINFDNITKADSEQFAMILSTDTSTEGIGYDYNSVMHYGKKAMAINRSVATIIPIPDKNAQIGNRLKPSTWDVAGVKKLYNQ